ncbi:MAG: type I-E CRISPR-associated endonuclease Cas1e [Hyphomicrobium sp.]|uniref:type I-E CRISPR-associated endonuclease Cas1e n=1 Tax=Hyphomicrobium sp. TaxID=82 RepID=UPI003D0E8303
MTSYIPLRRTPIRERASVLFLEHGNIDRDDGGLVLIDADGRTPIPVAGLTCLMLEPGTRISHAAVKLCAELGCLIVWTGEGGVRIYSATEPGGASARHLLHQARIALDDTLRLNVVRAMYAFRFGEEAPQRRSIEQLRGMEGVRVREAYKRLAAEHGVDWQGRNYDSKQWRAADVPNKCLSAATACLYGLAEAAILAAGYAPSIGFLHSGNPRAFVFDVADLFKFETVVPAAFKIAGAIARGEDPRPDRPSAYQRGRESAAQKEVRPDVAVRHACRDAFRRERTLDLIVPAIHDMLAASGVEAPADAPEAGPPAIPVTEEAA